MSEVRKKQLESDIAGLESDNRRARGDISRHKDLLAHAESGTRHAEDLRTKIKNAEAFIRGNEQKTSEMKRELRSLK